MTAVYKREMLTYFTTPQGYVFAAVFFLTSAFIFSMTTLQLQTTDISLYFKLLLVAYVIILPLLTMKTFAEEKRTRTDQLLLTSPVSVTGIILGKFFASFTMLVSTVVISLIFCIPLAIYGTPNFAKIIGCMIALIFVGMCFIAVGIFMSTLTENQFVAAIATIASLGGLVALSYLNSLINFYPLRIVLSWLSIYSRYQNFTYGIFDVGAALYYISLCAVFLFLTHRSLVRRRYV